MQLEKNSLCTLIHHGLFSQSVLFLLHLLDQLLSINFLQKTQQFIIC